MLGMVEAIVMPTIPQPAPSSRTLRSFLLATRASRRGSLESTLLGDASVERYEDNTRPASLSFS
jgi:hypothetical protein